MSNDKEARLAACKQRIELAANRIGELIESLPKFGTTDVSAKMYGAAIDAAHQEIDDAIVDLAGDDAELRDQLRAELEEGKRVAARDSGSLWGMALAALRRRFLGSD